MPLVASDCLLFYVLGMIYIYIYIYIYIHIYMHKNPCVYNYGMYRWHSYRYVSICIIVCHWHNPLLVDCSLSVVCLLSVWILSLGYICATVWCTVISLHLQLVLYLVTVKQIGIVVIYTYLRLIHLIQSR